MPHRLIKTKVGFDHCGEPSHWGPEIPTSRSALLRNPKSPAKTTANTTASATPETTDGTKNAVLKIAWPGSFWLVRSAAGPGVAPVRRLALEIAPGVAGVVGQKDSARGV